MPTLRALVYWTNEDKAGIEPLSHVAENCRFIGSVGPVKWSRDKKWYPARVLMISDNLKELEKKETEVALEILAKKEAASAMLPAKRKRSVRKPNSEATEQAIAKALGQKVPVPVGLQAADAASKNNKKRNKTLLEQGHLALDTNVLKVKQNLLSKLSDAILPGASTDEGDDDLDDDDSSKEEDDDDDDDEEEGEEHEKSDDSARDVRKDNDAAVESPSVNKEVWSDSCGTCRMLSNYANGGGTLTGLFTTLSDLFGKKSTSSEIQYLKLLPIKDGVKSVELTVGSNVFIPKAKKEELKVFFQNKPSPLLRETLFALYGESNMRGLNITARGNKPGTYGLDQKVLSAVRDFVNRQLPSEKKLKMSAVCKLINKRAPEWRKPAGKRVKDKAVSEDQREVVEIKFPKKTTPRKSSRTARTPTKSPRAGKGARTPVKSPAAKGARTPVKSPAAKGARTPMKSPASKEARTPTKAPAYEEGSKERPVEPTPTANYFLPSPNKLTPINYSPLKGTPSPSYQTFGQQYFQPPPPPAYGFAGQPQQQQQQFSSCYAPPPPANWYGYYDQQSA